MSNRTLDALRRLAVGGLSLLRTRVEYATLELSLARERILGWCVRGLLAVHLIQLAVGSLTALLAALLWPYLGPWSLLPFVLLFGGLAWWMLHRLIDEIEDAPAPLADTMRQLAEDQRAMAEAFGVPPEAAPDPVDETPRHVADPRAASRNVVGESPVDEP